MNEQVADALGIWSIPSPVLVDVREMMKLFTQGQHKCTNHAKSGRLKNKCFFLAELQHLSRKTMLDAFP